MRTHEDWLRDVAALAVKRARANGELSDEELANLAHTKLVYGHGNPTALGITFHRRWKNGQPEASALVEIAACWERDPAGLANTLIHELGHAALGPGHGHTKQWKDASKRLGLRLPAAVARRVEGWALLAPDLRDAIVRLPLWEDGAPVHDIGAIAAPPRRTRGCGAGVGTRGGRSRGAGSGSRLRLFECGCHPPIKVRAARDELPAHCDLCGEGFSRA